MLFNSLDFAIFFVVVVSLYFATPYKYRWLLLLASSYLFYMWWKPVYGILLATSTLIDYTVGYMLGRKEDKKIRKWLLIISLLANFGLLCAFKYFGFIGESINTLLGAIGSPVRVHVLELILPIGISFYTFQSVSYTVDVYKGKRKPELHLGRFALYIAFFPQLVAGPIERSTHLLPQFKNNYDFDFKRVTDGLKLMAWGLFKKIVIADRLAAYVDQVFGNPHGYTGLPLIVGMYFFTFQLYCDFSGYADIAIGASRVMGYDLMDNFKRPFFSRSIPELWRRWHISLMEWFKNYLYIPLGGNRVDMKRWIFNIMAVFIISGLWHGAAWTFVIWGVMHGAMVSASVASSGWRTKFKAFCGVRDDMFAVKLFQIFVTFNLFALSLIIFRARSLSDAWYVATHLFTDISHTSIHIAGIDKMGMIISTLSIVFMIGVQLIQSHRKMRELLDDKPLVFRWATYYFILFGMLFFGVDTANNFIYFQF